MFRRALCGALAAEGEGLEQTTEMISVQMLEGVWSATIDISGRSGAHRLLVRTCLGGDCAADGTSLAI